MTETSLRDGLAVTTTWTHAKRDIVRCRMQASCRICMPHSPSEWDLGERSCWELTILPELCRRRLRQRSIRAYPYTYCAWLRYLRTIELSERPKSPLSDPDPTLIRIFVDQIRARTSLMTAYIEAECLRRLFVAFDFDSHVEFLA